MVVNYYTESCTRNLNSSSTDKEFSTHIHTHTHYATVAALEAP